MKETNPNQLGLNSMISMSTVTLQDKLKFCKLVEPEHTWLLHESSGVYREKTKQEESRDGFYAILDQQYLESLCMRWLIKNQDKIRDYLNNNDYYTDTPRLSIDSIITLANKIEKLK